MHQMTLNKGARQMKSVRQITAPLALMMSLTLASTVAA
jgi:hypothetical protein